MTRPRRHRRSRRWRWRRLSCRAPWSTTTGRWRRSCSRSRTKRRSASSARSQTHSNATRTRRRASVCREAGIAVVGAAAVDAIASNRDLMSFVAVAAIFVLLLAAYRNPVKALAPLHAGGVRAGRLGDAALLRRDRVQPADVDLGTADHRDGNRVQHPADVALLRGARGGSGRRARRCRRRRCASAGRSWRPG